MRALLPHRREDVDVHEHYATDWVDGGGVRVDFVASVDGAVSAGGTSAGLQTPGDNRVFAALRDLADVVLVGAGTAVAERYRPARLSARRTAIRRDHGFAADLPIAVTSRSLRLDPGAELFTGAPAAARTLVLTCASAPAAQRARLAEVAEVLVCGEERVDPLAVRAALEERGLTRILSEGGPTAFAELAGAGVADELCLSLAPLLAGPGPGRITAGAAWPDTRRLALTGLLEEDGGLFLRYHLP